MRDLRERGNAQSAACGLALVIVALLGCKKDDAPAAGHTSAQAETPKAPAPPPTATAATAAATAQAPSKPKSYAVGEVPAIPSEHSNPPKGNEWDQAQVVNTQGAGARAKHCNLQILREWLRVTCNGDITGYEKMEDFGTQGSDYYELISPGKVASFVIRLKPGHNQKIRVCRKTDRASLFVSWPPGSDRPKHVALGSGPVCDGTDWGVGYGKKAPSGGDQQAANGGDQVSAETSDELKVLFERDQAAAADCKAGNKDACMFYCGDQTCT